MPVRLNATRRPLPGGDPFKREGGRYLSLFFPASNYFPADAENDVYAFRGLLLAVVAGGLAESDTTLSQSYYVPYHHGAIYGTGSDTCVGILGETLDATVTDHVIAAINRGDAIEQHCYEGGGPLGSVIAAAKTDLTLVKWV
jgi:hypothetical protein